MGHVSDQCIYPGACWNLNGACYEQEAVKAARSQPPAFLPWSTPMYANDNFMMVGLMIRIMRNSGRICSVSDVDGSGKATTVSPAAARVKLQKR